MTIEELSQLSDEELRVKVAEKMGVQTIYFKAHYQGHGGPTYIVCKSRKEAEEYPFNELGIEEFIDAGRVPPFSTSLDAIHEAEKTLTCDQAHQFVWRLREQLGTAAGIGSGVVTEWEWHATARERAIAFLMV